MPKVGPIDLKHLKTYPISKRKNLVTIDNLGSLPNKQDTNFIDSLPFTYAANDLRVLINNLIKAHKKHKTIVCAIGGHVIKVGCGPILIDLIKRGIITAIAMNGAAAIHDYELSLIGKTSENVAESLIDGSFGMARETTEAFSLAAADGATIGLGNAISHMALSNKHHKISLLAACAKFDIPITIHSSIGTDITHIQPEVSGQNLGASTLIDFQIISNVVAGLDGGVWMNIGSAVVMPEVFLKAVSVARNLGHKLNKFTTVNLDMIQHYRPTMNVLARPKGTSIALTGHHEIMIPLIYSGIIAALNNSHEYATHRNSKQT